MYSHGMNVVVTATAPAGPVVRIKISGILRLNSSRMPWAWAAFSITVALMNTSSSTVLRDLLPEEGVETGTLCKGTPLLDRIALSDRPPARCAAQRNAARTLRWRNARRPSRRRFGRHRWLGDAERLLPH
jgi:hypothetical protein